VRVCVNTAFLNSRWEKKITITAKRAAQRRHEVSRGRKPTVKWEKGSSRGAATRVATQSLRPGEFVMGTFGYSTLVAGSTFPFSGRPETVAKCNVTFMPPKCHVAFVNTKPCQAP
jgi:hypothetical protein